MTFMEFLVPYRDHHLWGYCDRKKNIEIQPKFSEAFCFKDDLAVVAIISKKLVFGVINKDENFIVPLQFSKIERVKDRFFFAYDELESEIFSCFTYEGAEVSVILDIKEFIFIKGNLGDLFSENYISVYKFEENTFIGHLVGLENKLSFHYFDESGILLDQSKLKFESKFWQVILKLDDHKNHLTINGKRGLVDEFGKNLLPFIYEEISPFFEGYASVKLNGEFSFVDSSCKPYGKMAYQKLFYNPTSKCWISELDKPIFLQSYFSSLNNYRSDIPGNISIITEKLESCEKFGLANKRGQTIFPAFLKKAPVLGHSWAIVCLNDRYGIIDNLGVFTVCNCYKKIEFLKKDRFLYQTEGGSLHIMTHLGEEIKSFSFFLYKKQSSIYFEIDYDSELICFYYHLTYNIKDKFNLKIGYCTFDGFELWDNLSYDSVIHPKRKEIKDVEDELFAYENSDHGDNYGYHQPINPWDDVFGPGEEADDARWNTSGE